MIVVVTGSREMRHHPERLKYKENFLTQIRALEPDKVYHGGADGPDTWAAIEFADIARRFDPVPAPARTPAQRLFDRNHTMIDAALMESGYREETGPVMVACWDGKSKGTKHAMDYAKRMGMLVLWNKMEEE